LSVLIFLVCGGLGEAILRRVKIGARGTENKSAEGRTIVAKVMMARIDRRSQLGWLTDALSM
jgi:hypothetical protein